MQKLRMSKKVKLTVIHTDGSAPNQHISAAEISILTPVKKRCGNRSFKNQNTRKTCTDGITDGVERA